MCIDAYSLRLNSANIARRFVLCLTLLFSFQALAEQPLLDVTLNLTGEGQVIVQMSNTGTESIEVLSWETAFESALAADLFDIRTPGDIFPAIYQGRVIKRGKPQPDDFIQLDSGESVTAVISLDQHYAIVEAAIYSVQYQGTVQYRELNSNGAADRKISTAEADSIDELESVSLRTEPVSLLLMPAPERREAQAASFSSCVTDQQLEINTALDAAESITQQARSDLSGLADNQRPASPRYLKWFGQYTEVRFDLVLSTFTRAENVMANNEVEFDCGCTDSFYAYVFPIDPYKVYLCPLFWNASLFGTDSRAGTILHELTHFPEIAGTDDHAYGARDASNLATTDPSRATLNADSYEYFAENTPAVDIAAGLVQEDVYLDLALNESRSGNLALRASALYRVSRAGSILLTSNSGDADLLVYSSAVRTDANKLCESVTTGEFDRCELSPAQEVYIEVLGYSEASYTLLVTLPNSPPVARNDEATTTENTSIDIPVLDNDEDADGNELSVSLSTLPSSGIAEIEGGVVSYQPDVGFTGVDVFNYQIDDGKEATAFATITVTVISKPTVVEQVDSDPPSDSSDGDLPPVVDQGGSGQPSEGSDSNAPPAVDPVITEQPDGVSDDNSPPVVVQEGSEQLTSGSGGGSVELWFLMLLLLQWPASRLLSTRE